MSHLRNARYSNSSYLGSNPSNTGALPQGSDLSTPALRPLHSPDFFRIAQEFYQGWLRQQGISDPESSVDYQLGFGIVGIVGPQRSRETNRAYDIIPREIVIEINRRASGHKPLDPDLVDRILNSPTSH